MNSTRPHPFAYQGPADVESSRRRSSGYTDEDMAPIASDRDDDRFVDAAGDVSELHYRAPSFQTQNVYGSAGPSTLSSPHRLHNSSMGSSMRGKRAPAPAALDLSPRSARVVEQSVRGREDESRYTGLGLGMPRYAEEQTRVVTDPTGVSRHVKQH
jgi:hypothetical protein